MREDYAFNRFHIDGDNLFDNDKIIGLLWGESSRDDFGCVVDPGYENFQEDIYSVVEPHFAEKFGNRFDHNYGPFVEFEDWKSDAFPSMEEAMAHYNADNYEDEGFFKDSGDCEEAPEIKASVYREKMTKSKWDFIRDMAFADMSNSDMQAAVEAYALDTGDDEDELLQDIRDVKRSMGPARGFKESKLNEYINSEDSYRLILCSENARNFISSVLGQMSDGYWEDSTVMDKYWQFCDVTNEGIRISETPYHRDYGRTIENGFRDKSDDEIKKFLAQKIKFIVKLEAEDEGTNRIEWKRDCQADCYYLKGTVADAYKAYDELMGRRMRESCHWSTGDANKILDRMSSAATEDEMVEELLDELDISEEEAWGFVENYLVEEQHRRAAATL